MDRLAYQSGKVVDASDARVAATLAGVLYGWGVFTTLRVYGGGPFAFDHHWERLLRHAERAHVAVTLGAEEARAALAGLIEANAVREGRARITVLKGDLGSWGAEAGGESEVLVFTSSEVALAKDDLAITLSPYRVLSTSLLAGVKRTAMVENLLALEEARARGFAEAVILNERGEIVSGAASNIFWVQGDEIFTPSLATGCVAGVTRRFVHEIARQWKLHVVEGSFTIQRLLDAREVFLTSTAREISIVASFDMKKYGAKQARIARLISRQYQKLHA